MGLHEFTWGATAVGSLMMGALAEGLGVSLAITIGGAAVVMSGLAVASWMYRGRVAEAPEGSAASSPTSPGD